MNKSEIEQLLRDKHQELYTFLQSHDEGKWAYRPSKDKWTTGQHIVHLIQSAQALNKGLRIPKLLSKYKWGTANRPVRSYEEVRQRYLDRLRDLTNPVSPISVNMPDTPTSREATIARLDRELDRTIAILKRTSDRRLDKYLLPHPAMGRMILREIIMWTAYHTEHHRLVLEDKYQ